MKPIEDLLKNLARPEVLEFGLVTNRLPSVNIGGKFEPVDDEAPTTEVLLEMLVAMGGGTFIEGLTDKPVQWTTRLDGVGVIAIAAIMRKDIVQARFTVARRDPTPVRPAGASSPPPRDAMSSQQRAAFRPSTVPLQTTPSRIPSTSQMPTPGPRTSERPSVPTPAAPARGSSQSQVPAAPHAAKTGPSGPRGSEDEEEDDDEPTVQTLSPPVSPSLSPANREEAERVAKARAEAERVAKESAEAERAAKEALEAKARAEAEAKARAEAEAKVRAEAEAKARAEAERIAKAKAAENSARMATIPQRARINTPTNVDAVDVETTTADHGARGAAPKPVEPHDPEPLVVEKRSPSEDEDRPPARMPATTAPVPPLDGNERARAAHALDTFLAMAVASNATDIHLVAGRPLVLRIATDLVSRTPPVPATDVDRIVREIVPVRLREVVDRDGSCDFAVEHPEHGRFRVNVARQRSGHKVAMRVIPRELPSPSALGIPDDVMDLAKLRSGLVLVTGPTGSGKTTTVAALVDQINRERAVHILTIESPIEHLFPKRKAVVSQRDTGSTARTVAAAIRSGLHEDPNVIVVGEVRDAESLHAVLDASESGALVFATIAGLSAAKTLRRMIETFPTDEQPRARVRLASSLRSIVAQRLMPNPDRTRVYAAFERIPATIALYTQIRDGRFLDLAPGPRGRALDASLGELVRAKHVTLDVAKRYATGDLGIGEGKS